MDSSDLRGLAYACKSLLTSKTTPYRKFTDPKLAGGQGGLKELTLGATTATPENDDYINLSIKGGATTRFAFEAYELASFIDDIKLICDETQHLQYKCQREWQRRKKI